jgi:uncharacterized protein YecE (DUF72 family)
MVTLAGTAGWSIPKAVSSEFAAPGTHLQRYSRVLSAVEINASFYRRISPDLYAKWAQSVPASFRFAVKIPKTITHEKRFEDVDPLLDSFQLEIAGLGDKLGCLLIQLPPSFAFYAKLATAFFKNLRKRTKVDLACEPRHASWFEPDADAMLKKLKIIRVAADPARVPAAAIPGGYTDAMYYRLHGSPRMYYSAYTKEYIEKLARDIAASGAKRVWCFFDNTASGAAIENALLLNELMANQNA